MCADFLEAAADLFFGARCRICRAPGLGCCLNCREVLLRRRPHLALRPGLPVPVWAAHPYRPDLAPLILAFKEDGAWSLAGLLGGLLSRAIACFEFLERPTLVPVPSLARAVRSRGIDHAATLARRASRGCGLAWQPALVRIRGEHQRGRARSARTRLSASDFRVRRRVSCVLLIDDVITTGATLKAAQQALVKEGIKVLGAAVIADANVRY